MPQGKPISKEVQWITIYLGVLLSPEDVAMYTNTSEQKIRAILAQHKRTGEVDIPKHKQPNLYQKLQGDDIEVSLLYFYLYLLY